MSRIGRQPVIVPPGTTVTQGDGQLLVTRGDRKLSVPLLKGVSYAFRDGAAVFETTDEAQQTRKNWGTVRSLFANAVQGLTRNFEKTLVLEGIGYRMTLSAGGEPSGGQELTMTLGFSHPVRFEVPPGVSFELNGNTLRISGADKQAVGQAAAEVRSLRKVEPYKGKGFHYADEVVRRKAGKKAAGTA